MATSSWTRTARAAAPLLFFGVIVAWASAPARATILPAGFVETLVARGMTSATASVHAPDGRIFVTEQAGGVRLIKDGVLLSTPFAQLPADDFGERGLLGITLHPDFARNGYVYV